jgi:arsenite/tail-anchored protein-transporting ATPase
VSTDPAPSLGDAFARPIGPEPLPIPARSGGLLHAVEIDAAAALGRWLDTRRDALARIVLRGTWLDEDDVSRLLRMSLPGIDELAALLEIARFASTGAYDLVVVDTAPTGHTLRMLETPDTLRALAEVFNQMQAKHRMVVETLRGHWQPDGEDDLIAELDRDGRSLAALLRDPARVRFSWVMLPEPMAAEETADAVAALAASGMSVSGIFVNRLTPPPERPCGWCDSRRKVEAQTLESSRERLSGLTLVPLAARDVEPRGVRDLARIGAEICAAKSINGARKRLRTKARYVADPLPGPRRMPALGTAETRLLLFGGKGGVGKTTCAAAAALALARQDQARRVLLLSTDPAHSLADVLGVPVSDSERPVPGGPPNLMVREIDGVERFRRVRDRYAAAIDAWFDRLSRPGSAGISVDARHDRRVMHGLIELAPPGIDELTAVIEVTDALADGGGDGHDLVVMDTAPSGHALRLLEMPAVAQEWARAMMSILLKYQPIAGPGELGAVLLRVSQGLGRLRALLADPRRTSFIAVTRAAALPREETRRLILRLRAMNVQVPLVLVNAVGRGTCARCRAACIEEERELKRIERITKGDSATHLPVAVAPAEMPPPLGIRELQRWQSTWHSRR